MESAVRALSALAHPTRLAAFRLMVAAGPEGLSAGTIAVRLALPRSTLSTHLALLERAGLARSTRDGRTILYAADAAGTRALIAYLVEDCCDGTPELCGLAAPSGPRRVRNGAKTTEDASHVTEGRDR